MSYKSAGEKMTGKPAKSTHMAECHYITDISKKLLYILGLTYLAHFDLKSPLRNSPYHNVRLVYDARFSAKLHSSA